MTFNYVSEINIENDLKSWLQPSGWTADHNYGKYHLDLHLISYCPV